MAASTGRAHSVSWQKRLQDHCQTRQLRLPIFDLVSDRRGGRTAWSSICTFASPASSSVQQTVQARYWYDGQYVYNAHEDAAEVALHVLMSGGGSGGGYLCFSNPRATVLPASSLAGVARA